MEGVSACAEWVRCAGARDALQEREEAEHAAKAHDVGAEQGMEDQLGREAPARASGDEGQTGPGEREGRSEGTHRLRVRRRTRMAKLTAARTDEPRMSEPVSRSKGSARQRTRKRRKGDATDAAAEGVSEDLVVVLWAVLPAVDAGPAAVDVCREVADALAVELGEVGERERLAQLAVRLGEGRGGEGFGRGGAGRVLAVVGGGEREVEAARGPGVGRRGGRGERARRVGWRRLGRVVHSCAGAGVSRSTVQPGGARRERRRRSETAAWWSPTAGIRGARSPSGQPHKAPPQP